MRSCDTLCRCIDTQPGHVSTERREEGDRETAQPVKKGARISIHSGAREPHDRNDIPKRKPQQPEVQ